MRIIAVKRSIFCVVSFLVVVRGVHASGGDQVIAKVSAVSNGVPIALTRRAVPTTAIATTTTPAPVSTMAGSATTSTAKQGIELSREYKQKMRPWAEEAQIALDRMSKSRMSATVIQKELASLQYCQPYEDHRITNIRRADNNVDNLFDVIKYRRNARGNNITHATSRMRISPERILTMESVRRVPDHSGDGILIDFAGVAQYIACYTSSRFSQSCS